VARLEALPSALRALPPAQIEVAWCADGRATVCPELAVASVLEPSHTLPSGRYRPHYRPLLQPVGGSKVSLVYLNLNSII
jgi:hypothetical protein